MTATAAAGGAMILSVRGIQKRFPGVHALKGVQLDVRGGEVHALVGENGAGKSTLVHILAGVHRPDEGSIDFAGRRIVAIASEREAQRLGIAIVYQERSLFGPLSVAENIFAGRQPAGAWGIIDRRRLHERTRMLLKMVGLAVEPDIPLTALSPAEQQMVEIAKVLSLDARLIIFDEPTAALTDAETRTLFRVIGLLREKGAGIIYISHRLEEIFRIADRVSVLKDGEWQGTFRVPETSPRDLVARMVGRDLSVFARRKAPMPASGPPRLEVRGLCDPPEAAGAGVSHVRLRGIDFSIGVGEVVALAGLNGSGRTEAALSIFGARPRGEGEIFIDGRRVDARSPAAAIAAGIGYLPEDRKDAGLFLDMSIERNIAAARLARSGGFWMDDAESRSVAEDFRLKLRIASRGVRQTASSLSGGNQQKVMLARWLLVDPKVLIVDEPTRGVDVGAKADVHALLYELAGRGTAVVVISSDLPEVLAVADRILVLREGRIAGEVSGSDATEEKVMRFASMAVDR